MKKDLKMKKNKKEYTKEEIRKKIVGLLNNAKKAETYYNKHYSIFNKYNIIGASSVKNILEQILKKYF